MKEEEKSKKKRKKAPIKREPSSSLEMAEREETRPKVKKATENDSAMHRLWVRVTTLTSKTTIIPFATGYYV